MNRGVTPGSADDYYRFNPWRSPGAAPTNDPCGMAGGTIPAHAGPVRHFPAVFRVLFVCCS